MIELAGVDFFYPSMKIPAISQIDLSIKEGEMVAIVGPNGSGKSTLAKLFNGILIPAEGDVRVDLLSTIKDDIYAIREKIGLVFQNPDNQIVASIVERDIAFAPENLGIPHAEMVERVEYALEVTTLTHKRNALAHTLSGGQKQKLAIAGVIAMKPKYIVLDEPFAMLDPKGRQEVLEVLYKLKNEGVTVILVTQFMQTVLEFERLICMETGKIVFDGEVNEFFSDWNRVHKLDLEIPLEYRMIEKMKELTGLEEEHNNLRKMLPHLVKMYKSE